jgi:hypothetical protein
LRILQELQKEAAATKRWEFTIELFNELCLRSGAVDQDVPDSSKRRLFTDLRNQLANKGRITVTGKMIRLKAPN